MFGVIVVGYCVFASGCTDGEVSAQIARQLVIPLHHINPHQTKHPLQGWNYRLSDVVYRVYLKIIREENLSRFMNKLDQRESRCSVTDHILHTLPNKGLVPGVCLDPALCYLQSGNTRSWSVGIPTSILLSKYVVLYRDLTFNYLEKLVLYEVLDSADVT